MAPLPFLNMFSRQLTKMSIATSVPIGFSLVGLQAIMDVKFSCPCKAGWNTGISALIFFVPVLFAFVIMFALLRPFQYKRSCCQKQNSKAIQGNTGASQGQDNSEISQEMAYLVCSIPSLVWICIFFIDGDYIACGFTTWNGRYACDKELHPNCFNWCKPTESPETNETECYKKTWELIYISKIIGYCLAMIFCIITIIVVCVKNPAETKTNGEPSLPSEKDKLVNNEDSHRQQCKLDDLQVTNTGSATEEASKGHRVQNRSDVSD